MPTGRHPHAVARSRHALLAVALSLASGLWAPWQPAHAADDYAPVLQMLRNGRTADALARADQYLATRPRDPQMQFLRAQALASAGRTADAIAAYQQLTQEYPELAEPHNNLAVLYASQNQLEPARAALEAAIRNNPTYATAHENLGDILLRLAVQSWSRARQLEPGMTSVVPKLAAARGLIEATPPARAATPFSPPAGTPSTPSTAPR